MTKQEKAAIAAICTNVFLTIAKFALAFLSGSLALLAETLHSFSDIGSSSVVFLAVRSEVKANASDDDKKPPWWRRNPQQKVAIGIGIFLLVVAVSMFTKVFKAEQLGVKYPIPIGFGMLFLALFSYLLSRLELTVGEKTGSTALVADGHHAGVDMMGSLLVAAALFGESLSWSLDRAAAFIISLFIFTYSMNVFAAVYRDMKRKEVAGEYIFPDWMNIFSRDKFAGIRKAFLGLVANARGFSRDDPRRLERAAGTVRIGAALLLLAVYLASGFFTLKPNEKAVVERFGKPVANKMSLGPGLHYKLPWPVDVVRKVDAETVKRIVVGSEIDPESKVLLWTNVHYIKGYGVLTGENIFLDIGLTVHYKVGDISKYLYNVKNAEIILESVAYSVALETMAQKRFFDIVTADRDDTEEEIFASLVEGFDPFDTGIVIVDVTLRDLHPPTAVAPDFEDVVSATVDYQKYISEADGYRNDLLPRARGESSSKIIAAHAQNTKIEQKADGETSRFLNNLEGYRLAPEVTRSRLYIETMEIVLAGRDKYILPESAVDGSVELYLLNDSARMPLRKGRLTR